MKTSQEEIEKLKEQGNLELAQILVRLNNAFEKSGVDGLEKEEKVTTDTRLLLKSTNNILA